MSGSQRKISTAQFQIREEDPTHTFIVRPAILKHMTLPAALLAVSVALLATALRMMIIIMVVGILGVATRSREAGISAMPENHRTMGKGPSARSISTLVGKILQRWVSSRFSTHHQSSLIHLSTLTIQTPFFQQTTNNAISRHSYSRHPSNPITATNARFHHQTRHRLGLNRKHDMQALPTNPVEEKASATMQEGSEWMRARITEHQRKSAATKTTVTDTIRGGDRRQLIINSGTSLAQR